MVLLAENPVDVMSVISQLGSAGMAALAIWWLTGKHEKTVAAITDSNLKGMEMITASLNKMEQGQEKRDTSLQLILEKNVLALTEMNNKIGQIAERQLEFNRRLEDVERKAHFKTVNNSHSPP